VIKSVYLDTSIYGGYFDEEFSVSTANLFDRIHRENIKVIVSEVLDAELQNAPKYVRDLLQTFPATQIQTIDGTSSIL